MLDWRLAVVYMAYGHIYVQGSVNTLTALEDSQLLRLDPYVMLAATTYPPTAISQEKSSSFGKYSYTERARLFSWQCPEMEMRLLQSGLSSSISICAVHTYTNIEQLLRIAYQLFSCLLIPDEHRYTARLPHGARVGDTVFTVPRSRDRAAGGWFELASPGATPVGVDRTSGRLYLRRELRAGGRAEVLVKVHRGGGQVQYNVFLPLSMH
ncbi:hypothetical protein AV530_006527 [Patagioenas fasciata monilis]|uniref:Uncharacterized protein n=1 Tax=Patagioenas fasciata monilis TaxID=372326 RepID=A0A1V4KGT6_PATFA|nr:hypothetical protein AV530_006527 [Patagioenas fasciata monilis]